MDVIAGESLKELFGGEHWQDLFEALSESLGFSLSAHTDSGTLISSSRRPNTYCTRYRSLSPDAHGHCTSSCLSGALGSINSGTARTFKCCAGILNFSVPLEYGGEKAVIAGRGSFENYDDFREFMNSVDSNGGTAAELQMPLVFSTVDQTGRAAALVAGSVERLLKSRLETAALRKKFHDFKTLIGTWGTATVDRPETLYREMIRRFSSLLQVDGIDVLVFDGKRTYTDGSPHPPRGAVLTLDEQDTIVQGLRRGAPYVLSAEAAFTPGEGPLYFFPIAVHGRLEAVIRIKDRALDEGDVQIVTGFCRQAGLAMENCRLREDLHRKVLRFSALSDLTTAIASIQNDKALLQAVLDKSADLLKAEQGSLMMLDREADVLLVEAKKGAGGGTGDQVRLTRGAGIAGKVAEQGEPLLVQDLENDPRIRQSNRPHYKTPSFVSVPLKIDNRVIGVLNLADKDCGTAFDEDDLKLIQSFAAQVAVVIERNLILNKTEELKKLIVTDDLTGLFNRRYLYERLKDELSRSKRHAHPLSLLMLDLDGFKQCNDSRGHLAGDRALKETAKALLKTVRAMDIVVRFGGDEFVILVPETGLLTAVDIAERLRQNVSIKTESDACPLTVSIGVACYPDHGDTGDVLIKAADAALYQAKYRGKNRIEVFSGNAV